MRRYIQQGVNLARRGGADVFIGSIATKAVTFVGAVLVARILTKDQFGQLTYIETLYTYALIFAGFGLSDAVVRYVVLASNSGAKFDRIIYIIRTGVLRTLVVTAAAALAMLLVHHSGFAAETGLLAAVLVLALPFEYVKNVGNMALRALMANRLYAVSSVVIAIILVAARAFGASTFDVSGAVALRVLATVIVAVLLFALVKRWFFAGFRATAVPVADRREMNRYALQLMLTNGLWSVFMLNDIMLVSALTSDPAAVANYKVAYTLPANMTIICVSVGIVIAPYFIRNEDNHGWVWSRYRTALLGLGTAVGSACLTLFMLAEPVLALLFGEQYREAADLMRVLLIAAFLNSGLRYLSAHLLATMGKPRVNLIVSGVAVALQVVAGFIIIPLYGAMGAAWVSVGLYALMAAVLALYFRMVYGPIRA